MIRALDPEADAPAVRDLYVRAADYVMLETGLPLGDDTVPEFFASAPPDSDPATSLKLGLWAGDRLIGLADVAFGYPEGTDAYIGLMLLDPAARGHGQGRSFFDYILAAVRERGATRLLAAVLEANPRAQSFWEAQGFRATRRFPPKRMGGRVHGRVELVRAV